MGTTPLLLLKSLPGNTAGIDEAGRGALAGPVVACCVVFKESFSFHGDINDSKRLSPKKRNQLFNDIIPHIHLGIGMATHRLINKKNILNATLMAMKTAIRRFPASIGHAIIDGNTAPKLTISYETMVKADAKIPEVMMASICAKVIRDRLMHKYHRIYTGYGFDGHKGYGTKKHYNALFDLGHCPIHRTSFNLTKQLTLF